MFPIETVLMSQTDIENASRDQLVDYLENVRGFQCYSTDTMKDLRECALLDLETEAEGN